MCMAVLMCHALLLESCLSRSGPMSKVVHSDDDDGDAAIAKQDKLRSRLDAEASVGVSSALVGGFALSLVPTVSDMTSNATPWIFLGCMSLSGSLCLLTVVTSCTIYWAGTHLLSATKERVSAENDLFRAFWKQPALRLARTATRRAFQVAIPLFLAGIVALVFENTDSVAMTIFVAVLFATTVAVAAWLTFRIEAYTMRVTATA